MEVGAREWLRLLREEYLDDFVRAGGAAVKFAVVADPDAGGDLLARVESIAEELGYRVARVDAARLRVHMMQDVFHAVARRMPWQEMARAFVRGFYEGRRLAIPGSGSLLIEDVGVVNGLDPAFLRLELSRELQRLLGRGERLAKDFRMAMLWLCIEVATHRGDESADARAVLDWLRGDLRLVSSMRRLSIFRRIGRHNARAMLTSLAAWCRMTGSAGLVVTLDIRQVLIARRADVAPDSVYYTAAAAMDAYEVLRQLIDSTDELEGVLCAVLAAPGLFEDERRGVRVYKALYERVWPDVRLRSRANPLSSLAQLDGGAEG